MIFDESVQNKVSICLIRGMVRRLSSINIFWLKQGPKIEGVTLNRVGILGLYLS